MAPAVSHAQSAYQSSASRPDADVVARVQRALQSDSTLDSRHIDVAVEHGNVVLKGFVQDNHALLAAQQVATKAAGTHKIVNQITIKQNPPTRPEEQEDGQALAAGASLGLAEREGFEPSNTF